MKNEIIKIVLDHALKNSSFISLSNITPADKKDELYEHIIYCWQKNFLEEIQTLSQRDFRRNDNPIKETSPLLLDYKITSLGISKLHSLYD